MLFIRMLSCRLPVQDVRHEPLLFSAKLVLLVAPEASPDAIASESQQSAWTCSHIRMSPLAQRRRKQRRIK